MNTTPNKITTNYRFAGVIPPTADYKWNKSLNVCVLANSIEEAIVKFKVVFPDAIITAVNKATDVHIL